MLKVRKLLTLGQENSSLLAILVTSISRSTTAPGPTLSSHNLSRSCARLPMVITCTSFPLGQERIFASMKTFAKRPPRKRILPEPVRLSASISSTMLASMLKNRELHRISAVSSHQPSHLQDHGRNCRDRKVPVLPRKLHLLGSSEIRPR